MHFTVYETIILHFSKNIQGNILGVLLNIELVLANFAIPFAVLHSNKWASINYQRKQNNSCK